MARFDVKIENIVASITIGKPIPIAKLLEKNEEIEYEPEQFPGLVYRKDKPKVAFLIFRSGKVICTGGKSIEEVKREITNLYHMLKKSKAAKIE